jgi:tetratricopeptide (TPR) repeat protein
VRSSAGGLTAVLPCLLVVATACGSIRAGNDGGEQPGAKPTTRTVSFTTDECTSCGFDNSPDGRWIVFDLLGQLWRVPMEGGAAVALTDAVAAQAEDLSPSISPDGQWIAFHGERAGREGLWIMPAGGGEARLLAGTAQVEVANRFDPAPDGRRIAFFAEDDDAPVQLWIQPAAGGSPARLTDGEDVVPLNVRWTPDGAELMYSAEGRLWRMPIDGGQPRIIPFTARIEFERTEHILVAVILFGLPVAIVVSWLFDFTPSGFKRDPGDAAAAAASARGAAADAGGLALEDGPISRPTPAPATLSWAGPRSWRRRRGWCVRRGSSPSPAPDPDAGRGWLSRLRRRFGSSFPDGLAWIDLAAVSDLTAESLEPAREWLEEAVRRSRALDGSWELGMALAFLGVLETVSGDPEAARACFQEALALQRARGDQEGIGLSVSGLAALEAEAGRHEESLALYRDAFVAYHAIGDRPEEARVLDAYAWTALAMERPDEARHHFAESLRTYEEVGSVRGIGLALLGLAATEAAVGRADRAVRIAAAAATFAAQEGVASDYARDSSAPAYLEPARSELEPEELARLETEGQALTVRAAMRYALEPVEPVVASPVGGVS